ncbi:MAG: hypothetical protein WCI51_06945, partial [Lentisphaerota bacterium]
PIHNPARLFLNFQPRRVYIKRLHEKSIAQRDDHAPGLSCITSVAGPKMNIAASRFVLGALATARIHFIISANP